MSPESQRWILMPLSFAGAFVLAILPFPEVMNWFRPEWTLLALVYWIICLPAYSGLLTAWTVGLLLDVLRGDLIGQNALALSLVAFLGLMLYRRLRTYSVWQQSALIFLLTGMNQLVLAWSNNWITGQTGEIGFLVPALCTALIWPWLKGFMDVLRRRLGIYS